MPAELLDIILNLVWYSSDNVIAINNEIAENISTLDSLQTALGRENTTFSLAMDGDFYGEERKNVEKIILHTMAVL